MVRSSNNHIYAYKVIDNTITTYGTLSGITVDSYEENPEDLEGYLYLLEDCGAKNIESNNKDLKLKIKEEKENLHNALCDCLTKMKDEYENLPEVQKFAFHRLIRENNINFEDKPKDILFQDFEPVKFTKESKKRFLNLPSRFKEGLSVRIKMGMFYTDEELDKYIKESLSRPLPGKEDVKPKSFIKKIKNIFNK